jgi:hypothetical protein
MAVFVGNGLEFYDFLTFAYFAVYISRTFYPNGSPSAGLLATLATFGAGFLTRPIGAIVIGRMGDRIGRKPAMVMSFTLMGVAIIGLALTPSYARIGGRAGARALFRLLQGFALGGEVGPTTAFMAEAAPPHRRGFYSRCSTRRRTPRSSSPASSARRSPRRSRHSNSRTWGWRLALILGAAIVRSGSCCNTLPETLGQHHPDEDAVPVDPAQRRPYRRSSCSGS